MAAPTQPTVAQAELVITGGGTPAVAPLGNAALPTPEPAPPKRPPAHYLWAKLIARIYEVFPLLCPNCVGQMRIISLIAHSADIRHIRQILDHIGVDMQPPQIGPARRPPLWEDCDAQVGEGSQIEPDWATDWDLAAQPASDYEIDQRVNG